MSTSGTGLDQGLYWKKYNIPVAVDLKYTTSCPSSNGDIWKWAADEDFIHCQSWYDQTDEDLGGDYNSLVSYGLSVTPSPEPSVAERKLIVWPYFEPYIQIDTYGYGNNFDVWSLAKVGYPTLPNTYKIVGIQSWTEQWGSFIPEDDDDAHEGHMWDTTSGWNSYGMPGKPSGGETRVIYTFMDGKGMAGSHEPGMAFSINDDGIKWWFHFFFFQPIKYVRTLNTNFTMHAMVVTTSNSISEQYIIRDIGSFYLSHKQKVAPPGANSPNWDAMDRDGDTWMVPYNYGAFVEEKGIVNNHPAWQPQYSWGDVHFDIAFDPDNADEVIRNNSVSEWIPYRPGALKEEIFVFLNGTTNARCYWIQKQLEMDEENHLFRIKVWMYVRQNDAERIDLSFTYLCLWKIGRPDPNPQPLQVGIEHPTCDLHYGPGEEWIKEHMKNIIINLFDNKKFIMIFVSRIIPSRKPSVCGEGVASHQWS